MIMRSRSYQFAFFVAILFHLSVVVLLLSESHHERPVLTMEAKNEPRQMQPQPVETPIQAVSVNNQEIMETVNRLKQDRARQQKAEENRQRALTQQAELARKQRIAAEQQHLEKLKSEAAQLAIAHQKQMLDEQAHLKQLAQQKIEQEKRLADMKQQEVQMQKHQEEVKKNADLAKKAADLAKKKADDLARANLAKAQLEKATKEKALLVQKQQAAAQQAIIDAANTARVAGEVDKYKALIINAISQRWILPENADSTLSSQFRIRLAPNGSVLEVSLTRSSGDPILDRSAQSAIYKASPLPVPQDPTTFNMFRDISLTVRPVNSRG